MATSRQSTGRLASFLLPEDTLDEFRNRARKLGWPQALIVQGLVEAWLSGEVAIDVRALERPVDPRTNLQRTQPNGAETVTYE
jgi:hypothetical protein